MFQKGCSCRVILKNLHAIMWATKLWQLRTAPTTSKPWYRLTLLGWRDLEPIQRDKRQQRSTENVRNRYLWDAKVSTPLPDAQNHRKIGPFFCQSSQICLSLFGLGKKPGKPGKPTSRTWCFFPTFRNWKDSVLGRTFQTLNQWSITTIPYPAALEL